MHVMCIVTCFSVQYQGRPSTTDFGPPYYLSNSFKVYRNVFLNLFHFISTFTTNFGYKIKSGIDNNLISMVTVSKTWAITKYLIELISKIMISLPILITAFVGAVIYYTFFVRRKNKFKLGGKFPEGPRGLPFIGNMHQLNKTHPFLFPAKWAEQYGDIYAISMAGVKTYVISDYKMVKEIFSQEPAFAGRLQTGGEIPLSDLYTNGQLHGIINTEGKPWEDLRRFTLRQLRDFGFGKNTMEAFIMDEVMEVLDWMKSVEEESIPDIKSKITVAVVNSLWMVISGHRYKHDDPKILDLSKELTVVLEEAASSGGIAFFWPWVEKLGFQGFTAYRNYQEKMRNLFTDVVRDHQDTYSADYSRDFIDVFLKEVKSCDDHDSAFFKDVGERQLIAVVKDLFEAGTETSSTTLSWIFLYMATFPEVQKKLQEEIDDVVGTSRLCSISDRPNLPYVEAFLAETLRYSSIVPGGVGHRALFDVVYKGYAFPKGTAIMPNQYGIHFNPKIWGDPQNFRPERFLSPDGKSFKKHDALIAFSTGKRQCVGETLARDTLFLYTSNIFQRFQIKFDPNKANSNPGFGSMAGFVMSPLPYSIVLKDRTM
ncbi:cytochrome P450 2J6 [Folsomia candida]|uniref:cytochrome P450 2J6 n=1 Tax=Folsomia candida TaxID=158441 RepID=UPI001604CCAC|nr:cytochrome P450 2J6 [Folsomia candida]